MTRDETDLLDPLDTVDDDRGAASRGANDDETVGESQWAGWQGQELASAEDWQDITPKIEVPDEHGLAPRRRHERSGGRHLDDVRESKGVSTPVDDENQRGLRLRIVTGGARRRSADRRRGVKNGDSVLKSRE
jgi:hypothetical protein